MATESQVIRTKRDGAIAITGGGGNVYDVPCDLGDLTWDVPSDTIINPLECGLIGATPNLRLGDEQPMTLGWTNYLRDLGDTAGTTTYTALLDLIHRYVGGHAITNWTSTMGLNSDVFTVTVSYTIDGSAFGEADKTVTFPFVVLRAGVATGETDTITTAGVSYAPKPILS